MVTQQLISKAITDGNIALWERNGLTLEYFPEYEQEYQFIVDHLNKYGTTPDEATFLHRFEDFVILDVRESEKYLIDTVQEERLYAMAVPLIQKCADFMQHDTNEAVEFLKANLHTLETQDYNPGIDLVKDIDIRYEEWLERQKPDSNQFISSSFIELDEETGGWRRGDELIVLFARTGNGKTFIMLEILRSAWEQGNRIGLVEPEMSASAVGYRFDTLNSHVSNKSLYRGYGADAYSNYVESLKQNEVPFLVASPKNFNHKVTATKLRNWCIQNQIQVLAIDGISYMQDERAERHDNRSTQLTHISEDLMAVSQELGIPIFIVSQANRNGVMNDTPSVDSIRDSDGIAYNASIVLSLCKTRIEDDTVLAIEIGKSRYGDSNKILMYNWEVDTGFFHYRNEEQEEQDDRPAPQARQHTAGAATSRAERREAF